jgi:AcrR family transcriptional regulator
MHLDRVGWGLTGMATARREERQAELVAAALRVLKAAGPQLSMTAVAAEAGVSPSVLHRYFDPASLVQALGENATEMLRHRVVPAFLANLPAMARIRNGVGAYFAVIDEYPNLYWLLARQPNTDESGGFSFVQREKKFIAPILTAVIGDYLRGFGLDSGAAEAWGYALTGLVQTAGEWWLDRRSMSRTHVTECISQLIWGALTGVLIDAGIWPDPEGRVPGAPHRSPSGQ